MYRSHSVVSFRTCHHGSCTTWLPCTGVLREMQPALLSASEGLCSSAPGEKWRRGRERGEGEVEKERRGRRTCGGREGEVGSNREGQRVEEEAERRGGGWRKGKSRKRKNMFIAKSVCTVLINLYLQFLQICAKEYKLSSLLYISSFLYGFSYKSLHYVPNNSGKLLSITSPSSLPPPTGTRKTLPSSTWPTSSTRQGTARRQLSLSGWPSKSVLTVESCTT